MWGRRGSCLPLQSVDEMESGEGRNPDLCHKFLVHDRSSLQTNEEDWKKIWSIFSD